MKNLIIILFGAPGSGKGYLGDKIKQEFISQQVLGEDELRYVSTGDLLRAEIASGSALGKEISSIINAGKLVSDELVGTLVQNALKGAEKVQILDGYPRTEKQFQALRQMLNRQKDAVFSLMRDTPIPVILERVSKRRVCESCKATHSADDGCCPKCGGKSTIRADDAMIETRLEEYQKNTANLWWELESFSCLSGAVQHDVEDVATALVSFYKSLL